MWAALAASPAAALAGLRQDVVVPSLVDAAIVVVVVVVHWQVIEVAELLMYWAQSDLYEEGVAVVERPVECADMATAEDECGRAMGNGPGGTVVAAMGLEIPSAILWALGVAEEAVDQLMAAQQGFAVVLAVLAAALAAAQAAARVDAHSLVGLAVVVTGEDIASVVAVVAVGSIAAIVAGLAVGRTVHCLEAASDVEGENTADMGAPT